MSGLEEAAVGEGTAISMVGAAVQDYLKNIYKLSRSEERVTPSLVADRLEVSPAAVSKMLKRLGELKLVEQGAAREVTLTPAGRKVALEIIRHHRLLELYLKEALGYTWDQVDREAEKLEHVISEEFEDRIDRLLGFPTHDPHGDPIPTKDGRIDDRLHRPLSGLPPGREAVIRRVSDADPAMLRYMADLGLYPETRVEVLRQDPFGGPLMVRVSGREHAIGMQLADHVFVSLEGEE